MNVLKSYDLNIGEDTEIIVCGGTVLSVIDEGDGPVLQYLSKEDSSRYVLKVRSFTEGEAVNASKETEDYDYASMEMKKTPYKYLSSTFTDSYITIWYYHIDGHK